MIEACPICRVADAELLWHRDRSPLLQFLPVGQQPTDAEFGELFIVQCAACGHVYNRAFDESALTKIYTSDNLSNVPVTSGMRARLEQTAAWIGRDLFKDQTVVEVGGGSGDMARIVARDAREVFVHEPCRGIRQSAFRERNVVLIPEMFSAPTQPGAADLVICRHVLEHTTDPQRMLEEIASVLTPQGRVYIEVPNFEFIDRHAAVFDFHAAHVQYFAPERLGTLAARAGLHPVKQWASADSRDFGLLFARNGAGCAVTAAPGSRDPLAGRITRRHERYVQFFSEHPDRLLLYGATWTGVAFLNAFSPAPPFESVLDDNRDYAGLALYHPDTQVPVRPPDAAWLGAQGDLFICPYQHAEGISTKVRALGFEGRIQSINEDPVVHSATIVSVS